MFIKLNYTSDKKIKTIFRIVTDIINTSSITNISALRTRAASASYDPAMLTGLDDANSEIIRTDDPAGVKAHYNVPGSPAGDIFYFTLEFGVYDNVATKYYTQITSTAAATTVFKIGTSITGGTMASSQFPLTTLETGTTTGAGTVLTLGNVFSGDPSTSPLSTGASGTTTIRTFWAYITNTAMIWCTTNAASTASGWPSTFSASTSFCGPHIVSQYTRYDYHNTDANGIVPVMYSNPRAVGQGFGIQKDWLQTWNTNLSAANILPFRVINLVNALPQVGTSWPIVYHPYVNHAVNARSSSQISWSFNAVGPVLGTVSSATAVSRGQGVVTVANQRYPTADLTGTGFALLPLQWDSPWVGNYGGNASNTGGFYIFNGDYSPGDTFTLNGKTWMVWPAYFGQADRIGLAIPKE